MRALVLVGLILGAAYAADAEAVGAIPPAAPAAPAAAKEIPTYRTVVIGNQYAEATLSANRGSVVSFALKNTHPIALPRHLREGSSQTELPKDERKRTPLAVLAPFRADAVALHDWIADDSWGLGPEDVAAWDVETDGAGSAVFRWAPAGRGMTYEIAYAMVPDRPSLHVALTVRNVGDTAWEGQPALVPIRGVHQDYAPGESYYLCWFAHSGGEPGGLDYKAPPAIGAWSMGVAHSPADYVGLKTRFFAAFWTPGSFAIGDPTAPTAAAPARPAASEDRPGAAAAANTAVAGGALEWHVDAKGFAGTDLAHQSQLTVGFAKQRLEPKRQAALDWTLTITDMRSDHLGLLTDVERRIEFTDRYYKFFRILAKGMTWCLEMIYLVVRNYGVAVICLTLLVKLALHRTSFKQQASMLKMQQLSPQLKALQEQYKDNKQQLALKQMELWKKNGVNPLGGCLPAFIQIPIFMGLYQAFNHSSTMRGQGFLWVTDLTLPDVIFGLHAPFISWLTINPLPLIYIGVTIWMSFHQKPPPQSDPQQEQMAKMMRWMPIFFGVLFYKMPAGLVLYFTTNALLSTLEIKYIKRKLARTTATRAKA